jgi:hypothetical protein
MIVGEAQATAGARAASIASFARAQNIAMSVESPSWRLRLLAHAQAKAGQVDEALAVVEAIRRAQDNLAATTNDRPHDSDRRSALVEIAKAMAKAGRTTEALEVAREVQLRNGGIGDGISAVAKGLGEAGRIDEALDAAKRQTNNTLRDDLLHAIIRERVEAGRFDHAKGLLPGIVDDYERARASLTVARGLFAAGATADGIAAVSDALKLATETQRPNFAVYILSGARSILPW